MENNKIAFWGALDISARTLEDIPEKFQKLYDLGITRMRPEEVERMEKYLKRSRIAVKTISKTLSAFKAINKK